MKLPLCLLIAQNFLEEIVHQKEPIRDALTKAERYIHSNKDQYLKPDQQRDLTSKMGDLKRGYDEVVTMAEARLKELMSALNQRRKEKDEMVRLSCSLICMYIVDNIKFVHFTLTYSHSN